MTRSWNNKVHDLGSYCYVKESNI